MLPLLAGLFYLADWVAGGSKSLPVPAIGLLCASTLLHEAICNRHPWVRRRLMVVAGVACGFALWFVLGREWLLRPRIEQIGSVKTADELVSRLKEMIQLMNRAFVYPALVIYMVTAYSDHLTSALIRRAPDEVD